MDMELITFVVIYTDFIEEFEDSKWGIKIRK
jgi:hypothetical protein